MIKKIPLLVEKGELASQVLGYLVCHSAWSKAEAQNLCVPFTFLP
jgi:hypothetical protein